MSCSLNRLRSPASYTSKKSPTSPSSPSRSSSSRTVHWPSFHVRSTVPISEARSRPDAGWPLSPSSLTPLWSSRAQLLSRLRRLAAAGHGAHAAGHGTTSGGEDRCRTARLPYTRRHRSSRLSRIVAHYTDHQAKVFLQSRNERFSKTNIRHYARVCALIIVFYARDRCVVQA